MTSSLNCPRGTYLRMDSLVIQCLGNNQCIMAMPGEKIKRGEMTVDIKMKESNREEFLDAISKADHKGDWYSMLLAEASNKELEAI